MSLAQELGRSTEGIVGLWSKMPMDDEDIAVEMKTTRRVKVVEMLLPGL